MNALDKYSFAATTISSMSVSEKQGGFVVVRSGVVMSVVGNTCGHHLGTGGSGGWAVGGCCVSDCRGCNQ